MAVKKRCIFCRKVVRADGTCKNPKCPLYKPEEPNGEANEDNGSEDTTEQ